MPIVNWPNVSYEYNAANRLLFDGANYYYYDYNGNMTSKGTATYTYDKKNNLTSYSNNGNYAYTYDGKGQRRSASRNGELTKFVLDQKGNVLADLNGAGEVLCYYVYGQGLISRIKPDNSTNYYIYDYRGSVVAMTDDTEEAIITHKYQYDDFGNIIQIEEADFNPYRYVGKFGVTYEDSCLYFMHARYYDPTIGRFLSEDPIWSTNLYAYADNNPMINIDYNGQLPEIVEGLLDVGSVFDPSGSWSLYSFFAEVFDFDGDYNINWNNALTSGGGILLAGGLIQSGPLGWAIGLGLVGLKWMINKDIPNRIGDGMESVFNWFANDGIDDVFEWLFGDIVLNTKYNIQRGWNNTKDLAEAYKESIGDGLIRIKKTIQREVNKMKKTSNCINAIKK